MKIKFIDNIENKEVKKSARHMIKNMEKGVKGNIQTFSKTLFSVRKEVTATAKSGAKRKNRGGIPVQQTAKSRRVHKQRGSQPATGGRKVKDLENRIQFLADANNDNFNVFHSLPNIFTNIYDQIHSFIHKNNFLLY